MSPRYALLLAIFCLIALGADAVAQINVSNSPLEAKILYPRIGADLGINFAQQEGQYVVGCGTFDEGDRLGVELALAYDLPFNAFLRVEALGGLRIRGTKHEYFTDELTAVRTEETFSEAEVQFNNIGTAQFTYLYFQPAALFYPFQNFNDFGIYAGAGPSLGFLASSSIQYEKQIVTRAVTLEDGTLTEVAYRADESSDPATRIFPAERPEGINSFLIDATAFVGMEIKIGRDFWIVPRAAYNFPLVKAISGDPGLTLTSMQFTLGGRYNFR